MIGAAPGRLASRVSVAGVALTLVALASGCSGSSSKAASSSSAAASPDPTVLLTEAKATLDATSGLHFLLAATDIPSGTSGVTSGEGDAVRPDKFKGTIKISGGGLLSGTVSVVSVGGVVWAKLPLLPGYHKIDPAKYGISDPGNLLNPQTGLSSLLVEPTNATYAGQTRVDGVVLDQVDATLPGAAVGALLGSADPSQPVQAQFGIEPTNHEIRSAVITGPFYSKTQNSTFTLTLSNYGETVLISAPS
jgi:hypothetical protein